MKQKNRIVVFANQKGGVGKSTLCVMFANYLASQGEGVAVVDADLQQTIIEQRERELKAAGKTSEEAPWEVMWLDSRNAESFAKGIETVKNIPATIIIDAPGNLADDNILPIFEAADYIIAPMTYHPNVVASTAKFASTIKSVSNVLNINPTLFFVPNMIDERIKLNLETLKGEARKELSPYGEILTRINRRAWLERTSTLSLTSQQIGSVKYAFDRIVTEINNKEK